MRGQLRRDRRQDARRRLRPGSRAPCAGSMRRKSRASVWRAISARAPASSTPVGPPPTTTKVSHARRRLGVGLALGGLEGQQHAPADLERVLDGLQAGRVAAPTRRGRSTSAWRRWPRPGSRSGSSPSASSTRCARGVDRAAPRRAAPSCCSAGAGCGGSGAAMSARRQAGGRHLVEQRLEQVVVAAVDQRHAHGAPAQAPRRRQARRSRRPRSRRAARSACSRLDRRRLGSGSSLRLHRATRQVGAVADQARPRRGRGPRRGPQAD